MGGGVSTDFKSSNRIELSWLVQVLLNFYWIQGSPWGGEWVYWAGVSMGMWGCPMHASTCIHMHTYMHMHVVNMINMDASMGVAICNFYTCIHVCVQACACANVWGHSPMPPDTLPPTWTLPRVTGSPNHQNLISLELIEIFRFCLKILYLYTFLNSYRL